MKKLTLENKILLYIIIFSLVLMIVSIITSHQLYKNYQKQKQLELIQSQVDNFHIGTDYLAEIALYNATVYSELPFVKKAYHHYYQNRNIKKSAQLIQDNFRYIDLKSQAVNTLIPKIHYHLPPARSFIRTWNGTGGDDLSKFRKTIIEISRHHQPIKGIEVGRAGFVIRGISPIFNDQQKYLGSVEAMYPFSKIFDKYKISRHQSIAIYMHRKQLQIASEFQEKIGLQTQQRLKGDFVFIEKNNENFDHTLINNEWFDSAIQEGKLIKKTKNKQFAFTPIHNFENKIIGMAVIQLDLSTFQHKLNMMTLLLTLFWIIILAISFFFLYRKFKKELFIPLQMVHYKIQQAVKGKNAQTQDIENVGKAGEINSALNQLIINRAHLSEYIKQIEKGNYDTQLKLLSEDDQLGKALKKMTLSMKKAREQEVKIKQEEEKRNWKTQGIAKFSDLIRQADDIESLSSIIIQNLVHYINATQGGLFLLNDEESSNKFLELVASYAYDRKKYLSKKILPGEGLVGTCAIEKQTIYLKKIPEEYIQITSGLGKARPSALLIVPLKIDEEVFGVIEIASIKELNANKIEFTEEIAGSIAASLSNMKIHERTNRLLEESQKKSEALENQEEMMRQNMEELEEAQKEIERKGEEQNNIIKKLNKENEEKIKEIRQQEREIENILKSISKTTLLIEYDLAGKIIFVNDFGEKLLKKDHKELVGKQIINFVEDIEHDTENDPVMFKDLAEGKSLELVNKVVIEGQEIWLSEFYSPMIDDEGVTQKVLRVAYDVTQEKLREHKLEENMQKADKLRKSHKRTIDKILKKADRKELKLRNTIAEHEKEIQQLQNEIKELKSGNEKE